MPGMIYADPRRRSPWETMIPQILGQLFLAKVGQNMDIAETERQATIAKGAEDIRREADLPEKKGYDIVWQQEPGYKGKRAYLKKAKETEFEFLKKQGLVEIGDKAYQIDATGVIDLKNPIDIKTQKPQKVWSKTNQQYEFRTPDEIAKNPAEYGMTKKTALEIKKAGAIQILGERQAAAAKLPVSKFKEQLYKQPGFMLTEATTAFTKNQQSNIQLKSQILQDESKKETPEYQNLRGKIILQNMAPSIKAKHPNAQLFQKKDNTWVWGEISGNEVKIYADEVMGYHIE